MQLDWFGLLFCLFFENHSLNLSKAKLTSPQKSMLCCGYQHNPCVVVIKHRYKTHYQYLHTNYSN